MRISNNIPALQALGSLTTRGVLQSKTSARLSTGQRINSAAEDSAGLAIGYKISLQRAGLEIASRNSSNGISLLQTADGALNEVHNIVQRMRELAVQSANDTYKEDDRTKMQLEINGLIDEIDAMSNKTEYNKIKLLNGEASKIIHSNMADILRISDQAIAGTYEVTVDEEATKTTVEVSPSDVEPFPQGNLTINGVQVYFNGGESTDQVYKMIKDACDCSDILAERDDPSTVLSSLTAKYYGSDYKIEYTGSAAVLSALGLEGATVENGLDAQITITAGSGDPDDPNPLTDNASYTSKGNTITIFDLNNVEICAELANPQPDEDEPFFLILRDCPLVVQAGPNMNQEMRINIPKTNAKSLELDKLNVQTTHFANAAISQTDKAVSIISDARARIGAYQNRLEYTVRSLDKAHENAAHSLSRIMDTDMAAEMTEYTKNSVISQAAMSILAQANQRPQQILQLL